MESQQETSHDILESLLQELVEREEDFSFYISLCLRLLTRSPQHGWDVKAFMRGLEPEDMAAPRDPAELRTNPKFLESEWLMGKYSILLEAFDEAGTSHHISTAAPKDTTLAGYDLRILWKIVNAHYSSYFEPDPRRRVTCAIEGLVGKDYSVEDLTRDLQDYLDRHACLFKPPDLCRELANQGKDLAFFADLGIRLLESVTWPVDDLRSFLQEIGSEDVVSPVGIPKLDWQELFRTSDDEIFADSERLMQKYSILADTLGELSSPAYSQVDLAARVAHAQYELFFEREGQTRLLKALRILLSEDYTADMLCTDAAAYLAASQDNR